MYALALTAMFVQVVDEHGAILLSALPTALKNVRVHGLLATDGVTVGCEVKEGKLTALNLTSPKAMSWRFRMSKTQFDRSRLRKELKVTSPDAHGYVLVECSLKQGVNRLVAP